MKDKKIRKLENQRKKSIDRDVKRKHKYLRDLNVGYGNVSSYWYKLGW